MFKFQIDKEHFMKTYKGMKDGSMTMYSQEEAKKEIDSFLGTLEQLDSFLL